MAFPEGFDGSEAVSQLLTSPSQSESSGTAKRENGKENGGNGGSDKTTSAKISRKRTKTGCLTCRKRRIKCGEERPTCNNCIKSKRVCEGYNQRVVFKDGMNGLFRPGAMGPQDRRFSQPYPALQPAPGPHQLQPIAPAPPVYGDGFIPLDTSLPPHLSQAYAERNRQQPNPDQPRINVTIPLGPLPTPPPRTQEGEFRSEFSPGYPPKEEAQSGNPNYFQQTPPSATASSFTLQPTPRSAHSEPGSASLYGSSTPFTSSPSYNGLSPRPTFTLSHSSSASGSSCPFNPPLDSKYVISGRGGDGVVQPAQEYREMFDQDRNSADPNSEVHPKLETGEYDFGPDEYLPAGMSQGSDNDYDRESEDDMDEDEEEDGEYRFGTQEDGMIAMETNISGQIAQQQISQVLEPFSRHLDEHSRISFRSFLPDAGTLATYQPMLSSSPLMNPVTAKIFCHFVYVLGPSMSLFERYPPQPHIAFTPGAGLHGPQNVWSYTVPMLSLSHPPLLHAILALSSLHISKLTRGPDHPSLLHYHIALRRLGKAIASDRHRGHVATLAATLMLAYYETMAAEHDKWSSHIHGAKQLLKEIDFDRVTRRVELLDDHEEMLNSASGDGQQSSQFGGQRPTLLAQRRMHRRMIAETDTDENMQRYLMGGSARRPNRQRRRESERPFSKKEMDHLRLQADMFWWYARMDCYQSLLSGCPLILDYIHWGQCPPRARIGTLGTTYGSSDHYFLLLGRLCDFQYRDLSRKRAVIESNGGHWIPPPEMGGPPPGQHHGPPPGQHGPPPGAVPPQMHYGMVPPPSQPPQMPRAFAANMPSNMPSSEPSPPPSPPHDLSSATLSALHEWHEIKKAFEVFIDSLGPEYAPLPIEYMPAHPTPFGSAIYYKTYSIASLQMLYNMAMIVLHRCHPHTPPISMMSTGIQARATAPFAINIARILAGLVPTDENSQINPALGASLIESTMPMFFAAVQYNTQEQRDWSVKKLREIHRLTGWATASRILLGCQRAWEMTAEAGRGPCYQRPEMEEEAEMFKEYHEYYQQLEKTQEEEREVEVEGGDGQKFLWKVAGRRTVDAAGILGDRIGF